MRDQLAERVLATVMGWTPDQLADGGSKLQTLARHKYDSYEGYRPGVKFLENLAGWLDQFAEEDRRIAIRFVLEELVFISRAEIDHLVETVYPDFVRPMLVQEAAARIGVSRFAVSQVTRSEEFKVIQRKLLVLGLSDGARIDRLRRSSPGLSHEQIYLAADIGDETAEDALRNLRQALGDDHAQFEHVLLVDDFYGSGTTLLRRAKLPDGPLKGRLWRTKNRLDQLQGGGALSENYRVSILIYIASELARSYVKRMLTEAGLDWRLDVIQLLPEQLKVDDTDLIRICAAHYDPILRDKHKPHPAPLGFGQAALPLVLHHNTPNNSICILWADTTDREQGLKRRALFPRYERHREDRA